MILIIAYVDNMSVIEAVYPAKLVNDKLLRVDTATIRESLARNEVTQSMVS